jgi:hypothetical protein
MIKLFGWEPKVDKQIAEKREDELKWLWKRRLLDLLNNNVKCASSPTSNLCHEVNLCTSSYVIPLAHMIATYVTFVRTLTSCVEVT